MSHNLFANWSEMWALIFLNSTKSVAAVLQTIKIKKKE